MEWTSLLGLIVNIITLIGVFYNVYDVVKMDCKRGKYELTDEQMIHELHENLIVQKRRKLSHDDS